MSFSNLVHRIVLHANAHEPGRGSRMRLLLTTVVGILIVSVLHSLANLAQNDLWKAVALRLYYFPILYSAIMGGVVWGTFGGSLAAGLHLILMFGVGHYDSQPTTGHAHAGSMSVLMVEHMMEIPFLIGGGALAGVFRDFNQKERREKSQITEMFGRYVSHQVVTEILEKKIDLAGEETSAAVLFTDLRNFTTLSEQLSPPALLRYVNGYLEEIVDVILANHGFLDKFIGDAVMAVFGVPLRQENYAGNAVQSAVQMMRQIAAINERPEFLERPIWMGVGIEAGNVVAGNIGSRKRMEYTVLGDTVNLASRIESLNKRYRTDILVSHSVHDLVRKDDGILTREIDAVRVKGRSAPVILYEVFSHRPADEIERKLSTLSDFNLGLDLYKRAEFRDAERCFKVVLERFPDDFISKVYLHRIGQLKENLPENWDGIFEFKKK